MKVRNSSSTADANKSNTTKQTSVNKKKGTKVHTVIPDDIEYGSCLEVPCIHHDGVPPGCNLYRSCPFNHTNPYLNSSYTQLIGDVGYTYFDKNRKIILGVASILTMMAFAITMFGCFALSTERSIVQRTYWAGGSLHNTTSNAWTTLYIGLRSIEVVNCKFIPGYESYPSTCIRESIPYTSEGCSNGIVKDACDSCNASAKSLWATAFFNCAGLILAFLGTQTRMKRSADIPIQKIMGMASDAWCVITLSYSLYLFDRDCKNQLQIAFDTFNDLTSTFWLGNGYVCYVVCVIVACLRATLHWVTPMPGRGKGIIPIHQMCKCENCRDCKPVYIDNGCDSVGAAYDIDKQQNSTDSTVVPDIMKRNKNENTDIIL